MNIFFEEDVSQRLAAIEYTAGFVEDASWRGGFMACLRAVRLSFGIQATLVIPQKEVIWNEQPHGDPCEIVARADWGGTGNCAQRSEEQFRIAPTGS